MKYLSFKKIIYYYDKIYKIAKDIKQFPIHATISLGNFCNHKCLWCTVYEYQKQKTKFINLNELLNFLKEAKSYGIKAVTYVGNGEPTTYPYFKELVAEVNKLDIEQAMFTNGFLLDKFEDEILNFFTWIRISLDAGSEQIHNKVHGVNNHFYKILDNIKTLISKRKDKLPTIGIQYAAHHLNIHDIYESVKKAVDLKADYFSIKPVFTRGAVGRKIERNKLTYDKLTSIVEKIKRDFEKDILIFYRPYQILSHEQEKNIFNYKKCVAGFFNINIYEDDKIAICGPNKVYVGDISMDLGFIEQNIYNEIKKLDLNICPAGCRYHELNFLVSCIIEKKFLKEYHINFI